MINIALCTSHACLNYINKQVTIAPASPAHCGSSFVCITKWACVGKQGQNSMGNSEAGSKTKRIYFCQRDAHTPESIRTALQGMWCGLCSGTALHNAIGHCTEVVGTIPAQKCEKAHLLNAHTHPLTSQDHGGGHAVLCSPCHCCST